ncbi:MAG: FtsW/RodA/SpoVE family cell cycle protein [Candidatus Yanofskybacteria bacterium]|nr:FtsW/RodA/SpoVE family cell cycle protein [Candidatus Yanofskybacteria bacterium]
MVLQNVSRAFRNYFREIDIPLFATTVAILLLSFANLYGIGGWESSYVKRQLLFTAIGAIAMIGASFFNYRYLKNYSFPVLLVYGGTLVLLGFALVSPAIRGIHAWIVWGSFRFEPSELAKIGFIAVMAKYFSQRHIHIRQFRTILISAVYLALPLLLVLAQPDLGSAVLLTLVWGGLLLATGINIRHLFALLGAGIIIGYLAWIFALQPYQKERLVAFINPYKDPTGIGYNIIQAKIAIGSGNWFGNGFGKGTQAGLGFLPEAHNDFAFAALAEQFGFFGVLVLMSLILLVVWRILKIGQRAHNNFVKLFCLGLSILILVHSMVSAAVNLGLMPITGIPFSFLSYGGSHLIAVMIGLGMVQSFKRYGS